MSHFLFFFNRLCYESFYWNNLRDLLIVWKIFLKKSFKNHSPSSCKFSERLIIFNISSMNCSPFVETVNSIRSFFSFCFGFLWKFRKQLGFKTWSGHLSETSSKFWEHLVRKSINCSDIGPSHERILSWGNGLEVSSGNSRNRSSPGNMIWQHVNFYVTLW